jgi:hypothetical protein
MKVNHPFIYRKERKTHPSERGWDVSDPLAFLNNS